MILLMIFSLEQLDCLIYLNCTLPTLKQFQNNILKSPNNYLFIFEKDKYFANICKHC